MVVMAARRGFLMPKEPWRFGRHLPEPSLPTHLTMRQAWLPYVLVAVLLVLTRLEFLPLKQWLQTPQIGRSQILGTDISASFAPLYLPGAVFVVVVLITVFLHRMNRQQMKVALGASGKTLAGSAIALGAAVPMVRIFINSGVNSAGLESMPIELANLLASSISQGWPVAAPIVGSLGSFISGSATFSNMMFSLLQFSVAEQAGLPPLVILAMQVLGANAGNMICVVNVVAAASVVKLLGQEGAIIRMTLGPMLYYALWAGILGLVLSLLL